jgi:hypothetical protein
MSEEATPVGSDSHVELRNAAVSVRGEGVVLRTATIYPHIDARAAAERLAEERA